MENKFESIITESRKRQHNITLLKENKSEEQPEEVSSEDTKEEKAQEETTEEDN